MSLRHFLFEVACPGCDRKYPFFDSISCSVPDYLTAERVSSHPKRCRACGFNGTVGDFPVVMVREHTWAEVREALMNNKEA